MVLPKKKPDISGVLPGAIGFLVGRVIIFQFVSPLAVAFAAGYLGTTGFVVSALLVFAGVASGLGRQYILRYAFAFGVLAVIHFVFPARFRKPSTQAAAAGGAALLSGLVFAALRGMSMYFAVAAVLESVFTACAAVVLQKSARVLSARSPYALTNEEQISFAILAAAVITGAMEVHAGLGWALACALLLMIAHKLGGAAGGAVALLLGVTLALAGYSRDLPVVLGVAAIAGGIFRGRKWSTAAGFAAGIAASAIYTGGLPPPETLAATAGGAALFLVAPLDFFFQTHTNVCGDTEYLERVRVVLSQRLFGFSRSFDKLSHTFSALAKPQTAAETTDVTQMLEDITERACHNCGMRVFCWDERFYETYRVVFDMLNASVAKGRLEPAGVPEKFRISCANIPWFMEVTNRFLEIGRINMAWQNRIVESRELIAEQLAGVSRVIQSLSAELDLFMNFKTDLEKAIHHELVKNGIEVQQVIVLENEYGKYEVSIKPRTCPGWTNCVRELSRVVSRVLGRRMLVEDRQCTYNNGCTMRMIEEQKFRIVSGVARRTRTGSPVSGDNYSFMELRNGQCLLALSDGMGSGEKAREESAAAVELLEDFIESGFEKDMAVKMINSVLVLKNDEDNFSTLDICSVDLHTGVAEFIKIGAAATYLLRGGEVTTIQSSSLPIGMLHTVDLEVSSKVLKENDIIVMMTDGLEKSAWVCETLRHFDGRNPQDVADHLLRAAEEVNAGVFRDDVTVLAARIWQRS